MVHLQKHQGIKASSPENHRHHGWVMEDEWRGTVVTASWCSAGCMSMCFEKKLCFLLYSSHGKSDILALCKKPSNNLLSCNKKRKLKKQISFHQSSTTNGDPVWISHCLSDSSPARYTPIGWVWCGSRQWRPQKQPNRLTPIRKVHFAVVVVMLFLSWLWSSVFLTSP